MWVFTWLTGGCMKVILLMWHYNDVYDTSEGVIGLYKTRESAEVAARKWSDSLDDDREDYKYSFEEMEVND